MVDCDLDKVDVYGKVDVSVENEVVVEENVSIAGDVDTVDSADIFEYNSVEEIVDCIGVEIVSVDVIAEDGSVGINEAVEADSVTSSDDSVDVVNSCGSVVLNMFVESSRRVVPCSISVEVGEDSIVEIMVDNESLAVVISGVVDVGSVVISSVDTSVVAVIKGSVVSDAEDTVSSVTYDSVLLRVSVI